MKRIALIVVLVVVACASLALWISGRQALKTMGDNRTTRSHDGTIIAFTKQGSGPPLIIVDGAFCYRENGPATELASVLAQHFTVFTYDRRGRGVDARGLASLRPESLLHLFNEHSSSSDNGPFSLISLENKA